MRPATGEPIEYDVFALADFAGDSYTALRERIDECLATFECERSEHLQSFARGGVKNYEKHGHSRTYVLVTSTGADIDVAGFFTIGMTSLDLSKASKTSRAKLMGNVSMEVTGAYCIAELARSDRYTSTQLPGRVLLDEAKQVVSRARSLVAGRFIVVDAQEVVFESLYKNAGFKRVDLAKPPLGMEDRKFVTACCVIKDW